MTTKHLDIGCGTSPRNPFNYQELHGVDIIEQHTQDFNYRQCNVVFEPLPFEDSTFDSVSAYDFIEHIPRVSIKDGTSNFSFIEVMNEIYRVLKPNGKFYAETPAFPREEVFIDPTHVNFITRKTHIYFTEPHNVASMYGFNGKFLANEVKWINPAEKTIKRGVASQLIRNIYLKLKPSRNTHLLWIFTAIKNDR